MPAIIIEIGIRIVSSCLELVRWLNRVSEPRLVLDDIDNKSIFFLSFIMSYILKFWLALDCKPIGC